MQSKPRPHNGTTIRREVIVILQFQFQFNKERIGRVEQGRKGEEKELKDKIPT